MRERMAMPWEQLHSIRYTPLGELTLMDLVLLVGWVPVVVHAVSGRRACYCVILSPWCRPFGLTSRAVLDDKREYLARGREIAVVTLPSEHLRFCGWQPLQNQPPSTWWKARRGEALRPRRRRRAQLAGAGAPKYLLRRRGCYRLQHVTIYTS